MSPTSKYRQELLNIIILEDDADRRRRFVEILQSLPEIESVRTVKSEGDLIGICSISNHFSMAIIGGVAKMGTEVAIHKIRQDLKDLCPPIICSLKTIDTSGGAVAAAFEAGANAFIVEPISGASVSSVLQQLRESEVFRTFQQRSAESLLRISISFACKLIDQSAQLLLKGQSLARDTLREWRKLKSSLHLAGRKVDSEGLVRQIELELASAYPFRAREPERELVKKRAVPAAEVVAQVLQQRGIPIEKLQELVRIDPTELKLFLEGKASMSFFIAAELARVLGHDKAYWMNFR